MQVFEQQLENEHTLNMVRSVLADDRLGQRAREDGALDTVDERLNIAVLLPQTDTAAGLGTYCENLSGLLQGRTANVSTASGKLEQQFHRLAHSYDLVLLGMPRPSLLQRLLFRTVERRTVCQSSATVLVVQAPRWPIRRILLVLRVQPQETFAVDWAGKLCQLTGAELIIQPLVPEQPLMYGRSSRLQITIDSLLTPGTPCGEQLRSLLGRLNEWQVQGTLRVRQGEPLWQVRTEAASGNCDLIVIGADPYGRMRRWFGGEFMAQLIDVAGRPVLVVGNRRAGSHFLQRAERTRGER